MRVALMDGSLSRVQARATRSISQYPSHPDADVKKYTAGLSAPAGHGLDRPVRRIGRHSRRCHGSGTETAAYAVDLFTAIIFFGGDDDALNAVDAWRPIAELRMLEYVDREALRIIRPRFPRSRPKPRPHSSSRPKAKSTTTHGSSAESANALADASWFAISAEDRERFRRFRHTLPEVVIDTVRKRGFKQIGTDYSVPLHRNRDIIRFYHEELDKADIGMYMIFGHIGDAHVHINIVPETAEQPNVHKPCSTTSPKRSSRWAAAFGGARSRETESAPAGAPVQPGAHRSDEEVKRRLDPKWLLGRGTLFPYHV
jgi:FAD/FMN-containing dehydrogenase